MADEQWWNEFFAREQAHSAQPAQSDSTGSADEDPVDSELRLLFHGAAPAEAGLADLMSGYADFEKIIAEGGTPPYHDVNPGSPRTQEFEFARYRSVLAALQEVIDLCRQTDAAESAECFEKEFNSIESMTQSQRQEQGFATELVGSLARINVFCGFFHPMLLMQMGPKHFRLLVAIGTLRAASEKLRTAVLAQREANGL